MVKNKKDTKVFMDQIKKLEEDYEILEKTNKILEKRNSKMTESQNKYLSGFKTSHPDSNQTKNAEVVLEPSKQIAYKKVSPKKLPMDIDESSASFVRI